MLLLNSCIVAFRVPVSFWISMLGIHNLINIVDFIILLFSLFSCYNATLLISGILCLLFSGTSFLILIDLNRIPLFLYKCQSCWPENLTPGNLFLKIAALSAKLFPANLCNDSWQVKNWMWSSCSINLCLYGYIIGPSNKMESRQIYRILWALKLKNYEIYL